MRLTLRRVPKSKGRKPKKPAKKSTKPTRAHQVGDPFRARSGYNVGTLKGSDKALVTLLDSEHVTPDQLVEMLLPLLWLYHCTGMPGNLCVDGSMVLHYAYEQFGITAEPKAVDLVVSNRRTDQRTLYGRPDPYWDGTTFNGHCVLWLPQSGRFLDATVEQYPEVRRHRLGPIIGRVGATAGGTPAEAAAMQRGELPHGVAFGVRREDLMLLYTTVGSQHAEVLTHAPLIEETRPRYRRAGINLASHALSLLQLPEAIDKARAVPYPRLHALLDAVAGAEFSTDADGDIHFTLPVEAAEMSLRLDDLDLELAKATSPAPRVASQVPSLNPDHQQLQAIMDDVETDARTRTSPTAAMGGGHEPVVLFEPRQAIGLQQHGGPALEAQAEAIIAAGFTRFTDGAAPTALSSWSVQETESGLELWEQGGIWARATLDADHAWRQAAAAQGTVRVLYGVRSGVRAPEHQQGYTEQQREGELSESRSCGIVAAARVPWIPLTA